MLLHLGQESLDPKSPVEDDKEESQLHISRWERKGEKVPIYKFLFFLSFPFCLSAVIFGLKLCNSLMKSYVLLIKTNVFFFIRKLCSLSLTHLGDHSVSLGKIKVYSDLADGATTGYIKRKE